MVAEDDVGELTPDEARDLILARNRRAHLAMLRTRPEEWWKRGMRDPAAIQALVAERLEQQFDAEVERDPTYDDFLVDPA
jgi:hypothetical protein